MLGSTSRLKAAGCKPVSEMTRLAHLLADVFSQPGLPVARRFTRILDGACTAFGMDDAYIAMTGRRARKLRFGITPIAHLPGFSGPCHTTTTDWIAANGKLLEMTGRAAAASDWPCDLLGRHPGQFLGAPIIFDGRTYGTVELVGEASRQSDFEEVERSMIRLIGTYAAVPLVLLAQG